MTQELSTNLKDLDIKIENVVASASLDQRLELIAIMKEFRNACAHFMCALNLIVRAREVNAEYHHPYTKSWK